MTLNTITYRKINLDEITPYEIDQVAYLVTKLAEELRLEYDKQVIYTKTESFIREKVGELYCMVDSGTIVGVMGFAYALELWNDTLFASEIVWYVLPAYRGRGGIYLIKEVEKNIKAGKIRVGAGNPKLVKLLIRMGWIQEKTIMTKVL